MRGRSKAGVFGTLCLLAHLESGAFAAVLPATRQLQTELPCCKIHVPPCDDPMEPPCCFSDTIDTCNENDPGWNEGLCDLCFGEGMMDESRPCNPDFYSSKIFTTQLSDGGDICDWEEFLGHHEITCTEQQMDALREEAAKELCVAMGDAKYLWAVGAAIGFALCVLTCIFQKVGAGLFARLAGGVTAALCWLWAGCFSGPVAELFGLANTCAFGQELIEVGGDVYCRNDTILSLFMVLLGGYGAMVWKGTDSEDDKDAADDN